MEISVLKPQVVGKLSLFSGMYYDALMHREGLKGLSVLLTDQITVIGNETSV